MEILMATNNVKRGANRAYAYGKRAKASQQSMLPLRTDVAAAAHAAALEDARRDLAEHTAQERAKRAAEELSSEFGAAYDARTHAQQHGWSVAVTTGWLGEHRSATLVASRGQERVMITWEKCDGVVGVPRQPLYTIAGRNTRFADTAAALSALGRE